MSVTKVFTELDTILDRYQVSRQGVFHAGANQGQELQTYRDCRFSRIVLAEPTPALCDQLRSLVDPRRDEIVLEVAITEEQKPVTLYVTKWHETSSIHEPVKREVIEEIEVAGVPLNSVQFGCNVLVADCQGAELAVLKGADLKQFDLLIVETFPSRRYKGAAVHSEIVSYLNEQGWLMVEQYPHKVKTVVDCVFIKKSQSIERLTPFF